MNPTVEYIAAPEQLKSRHEAQEGSLVVTVENIDESSFIYVSNDAGITHELLKWELTIWGWLLICYYGIPWPAKDIWRIKSINIAQLTILYVDPQWSEPDLYVYATYCFKEKKWRLKVDAS
jgi:hypothetical protein